VDQPVWIRVPPDGARPGVLGPAVAALRAGSVVVVPTDTLYALAVDPRDPEAVARVFRLKGRQPGVALPLAAASVAQVEATLGALGSEARRLADRFWPGPLSLIVRAPPRLAAGVAAADGSIAVRVPANPVTQDLAAGLGFPITVTSANVSGRPPAATAPEIATWCGDRVAVIVDGGPNSGGPPSTIVAADATGVRLVRAGAIAWARVLESLQ